MNCEKCGKFMILHWDYKAGKCICKSCADKYRQIIIVEQQNKELEILNRVIR